MRLTRVVYAPPRIDGSGFVSTPHLPQHSRALEIRRSRAHGRRWPSAQIRPYALVRRPVPPRVMGKWPLCAYSLAVVASGGHQLGLVMAHESMRQRDQQPMELRAPVIVEVSSGWFIGFRCR